MAAAAASGANQPPRRPPKFVVDLPMDAPEEDIQEALAEYIRQFRERWRRFLNITATARSSLAGIREIVSNNQQANFANSHMILDKDFNAVPININGDPQHQDIVHHWRLRNRVVRGITDNQFGEVERHTIIINSSYHDLVRDLLMTEPVPESKNEWFITQRPFLVATLLRRFMATPKQRRDEGLPTPSGKRVIFDPYGGIEDDSVTPFRNRNNMVRGINDQGMEFEYSVTIDRRHLVVAVLNGDIRLPAHFEGTCSTSHGGEVEYLHHEHEFIMLELALLVMRNSRDTQISWENEWVIEHVDPAKRSVTCGTWVNPKKRVISETDEFKKLTEVQKQNHLARFRFMMSTETRVVDLFYPDQVRMYQESVANLLAPFQKIFSDYYQFLRIYDTAIEHFHRGGRPFRRIPTGRSNTVDDPNSIPSKKRDKGKRRKSD